MSETTSVALRDIETTLLALTDVDPAELEPELRAIYERELAEAIRSSVEKRERVAWRLFDLGQRAAVKRAAAQAHHDKASVLEQSAKRYEADADRLKNYVLDVMKELPKPKKGPRVLEGTSATFKAKGVADSVEITDEAALPDEFKTVILTMPLAVYLELAPEVCAASVASFGRVRIAEIKAALEKREDCPTCHGTGGEMFDGREVRCGDCDDTHTVPATIPGARLVTGKLRLVVE